MSFTVGRSLQAGRGPLRAAFLALVAALFALPSAAFQGDPPPGQPAHPNVLVVVLDDAGAEKLRPFGMGAPYAKTPNLNALAQRGVTFTNFYANPLCGPSRATLQTGRYSFRTGFGPNIFPLYQFSLPDSEVTLAEMVRDGFAPRPSPYARAAFGKWHMARYDNLTHPNDNGYQRFSGCLTNVSDRNEIYGVFYNHFYWRKLVDGVETEVGTPIGPFDESTYSASVCVRDAGDWMLAQSGPFFSVVSINPPHAPYQVPPFSLLTPSTIARLADLGNVQVGHPYVAGDYAWIDDLTHPTHPLSDAEYRAKKQAFFDASIEAADATFGQLLARIASKLDQTMILVVGDNGTDGGVIDETRYSPLHGKRTCYEQGVRAPMIVAGPLVAQPGRMCDFPVGIVDVWATVRDLVGARNDLNLLAPGLVLDSRSFANLLTDAAAGPSRPLAFSEAFNPVGNPANIDYGMRVRMISDGHWKLMRSTTDDIEQLYNLDADPLETQNLLPYSTRQQKAHYDRLKAELDALVYSSG